MHCLVREAEFETIGDRQRQGERPEPLVMTGGADDTDHRSTDLAGLRCVSHVGHWRERHAADRLEVDLSENAAAGVFVGQSIRRLGGDGQRDGNYDGQQGDAMIPPLNPFRRPGLPAGSTIAGSRCTPGARR